MTPTGTLRSSMVAFSADETELQDCVLSLQPQGHCVLGAGALRPQPQRQRPEHSARLLGRVDLGLPALGP